MSGFSDLFSGMNFKGTIQKYCGQQNWKIAEIDEIGRASCRERV